MALNLSIRDFYEMGFSSGSQTGGGATDVLQNAQSQEASLIPAGISALGSLKTGQAAETLVSSAEAQRKTAGEVARLNAETGKLRARASNIQTAAGLFKGRSGTTGAEEIGRGKTTTAKGGVIGFVNQIFGTEFQTGGVATHEEIAEVLLEMAIKMEGAQGQQLGPSLGAGAGPTAPGTTGPAAGTGLDQLSQLGALDPQLKRLLQLQKQLQATQPQDNQTP